jgi:immunity protein 5 of polymorphic toxin system
MARTSQDRGALARDRRFVAVHRGGPLDLTRHRLLAIWAADCAEHVLPLFTDRHPDDDRPRLAIDATRAWSRGEITVGAAREAAFRAHAAARDASDAAARAAARAAGQAVSTPHMADHSLGAAAYAVRAAKLAADADGAQAAGDREREWQSAHVPEAVRELVMTTQAPDAA